MYPQLLRVNKGSRNLEWESCELLSPGLTKWQWTFYSSVKGLGEAHRRTLHLEQILTNSQLLLFFLNMFLN